MASWCQFKTVNKAALYIPNIFMAAIILFAGYILAKIVRGIVEGLVNSLDLQTQVQKVGLFKNSNLPDSLVHSCLQSL